jgi:DNA-binding NtrC family response regulator
VLGRDEPAGAAPVDAIEAAAARAAPVSLREAERTTIAEALRRTGGNKSRASRVLGISRKQLYVKIRGYGLAS